MSLCYDVDYILLTNYIYFSFITATSDYINAKDLGIILKAAWKARVKWYNIGLELCIAPDTLDVIQNDNRDISDRCFREMLKVWLKSETPPTWTELVKALRSPTVGYQELAEELAQCHCPENEGH